MGSTVNATNDPWGTGTTNPVDAALGTSNKKKSSGLDMSDFLKLMAAQFENQSIDGGSGSGGSDNTSYITELAQFSAIQAMTTMSDSFQKEYAASLVGSDVVLTTTDSTTGQQSLVQGTVEKACFDSSGNSYLMMNVNGKDQVYDLSDVTEVLGYHQTSTGGSGSGGSGTSGSTATPKI